MLVSRQNTYDIAFPAAAMYLAQADGEYSAKEKEFYHALLSRMSFDDHTRKEFQKLVASEENLLDALAQIEDDEVRDSLVETLVLMAIYDGELIEEERQFLASVAAHLNVPLDIENVQQRAVDYRIAVEEGFLQKTTTAAKDASEKAVVVAGQAADTVKDAASKTGEKVSGALGRIRRRWADEGPEGAIVVCGNCGTEVPAEYSFCPSCGQAILKEKHCVSCDEVMPIQFAFCPHCGAQQG
jgi:tellurite resistance protein/RNA polymerase subunit RPABC4/transcription elongation factor Spt4